MALKDHDMKRCTNCGDVFLRTSFPRNGKYYHSWCKDCKNGVDLKSHHAKRNRRKPITVYVVEHETTKARRPLRYDEYYKDAPDPKPGWVIVGTGLKLLKG